MPRPQGGADRLPEIHRHLCADFRSWVCHVTTVVFDASDFARIADIYDRLPEKMRTIAFGRAAARAKGTVERNYAQFASKTLKIAQKHVRSRMRSSLSDGDITLVIRSKQIPLDEIGADQRGYGVHVRGRGRYEDAFIAAAKSKRAAGLVLHRKGKDRLPTAMLFGPNPAHAVLRKPADYEDLLADIAAGEFAKTILQQAAYLLAQAR